MQSKLTLSIDDSVIRKAKEFAKKNHTSLSQMIEDYFSGITQKAEIKEEAISPALKSLVGILKLPNDYDFKNDRTEFLEKKYK